jgi:SAM-dependent methyltransferase
VREPDHGHVFVSAYERLGVGYAAVRRPDRRIAASIHAALGRVGPVINVGAGAGSYEPVDLAVVAVEPSVRMLEQRRAEAAPALRARAEELPFPSRSFAAGMAILTVHHWEDPAAGLAELRRVVRGPIAVLSWDAEVFDEFWMVSEYVPATRSLDRDVPSPAAIARLLGGGSVEPVPVPADCTDGFYAAWWRRPDAYLEPSVRAAISGLARLDPDVVERGIQQLADDLATGWWHRRHADLLNLDTYDAGYRLVIAR